MKKRKVPCKTRKEMERNLFTDYYQYVKWKCAPEKYDRRVKHTPAILLATDMYMPSKKRYGPRPNICINTNGLNIKNIKNENLYIRIHTSEKYLKRVLVGLTVDSKATSILGHLWYFQCHMNNPKDVRVTVSIAPESNDWYKNNIMIDVSEDFHNGMLPYFNHDSFIAAKEGPVYGN